MLSRVWNRPPPKLTSTNYSPEHVALAKTIRRRRKIIAAVSARIPLVRAVMVLVGVAWILALPYEGLWKNTYIDEHAIQPAQVTMYFDWSNVHKADRYLDSLEALPDDAASADVSRSEYLQSAFSAAGLSTSNTSLSTYAHITPPRSSGTEAILLSANWVSRDGTANLRGVAMLLAMGEFLRGQNHWAFDLVLVVGEGYLEGLEDFMSAYRGLFPGVIWTALNIDYPGHSFSHLGIFYEGVNGRLPNQDLINTVSHVARWAGGVPPRLHNIPDDPHPDTPLGRYKLAAKHLWEHFRHAALGRPSAAHGVLAKHRIDSATLYCSPATGPHGFHTLGRTLESTLRSLNNLLERLHASYFFYLLPRPGKFLPVGHYLPSAIILGASITIAGFDCPDPLAGLMWLLPAFGLGWIGWALQTPWISFLALAIPRPTGNSRKSLSSLTHLLYGALIPTLAMVNYPQALLLAAVTIAYLAPYRWIRLALLALHPGLIMGLKEEWETVGNLAWPGIFAIWVPLWCIAAML
ncbi:Gaa1-like protein [Naematelia encephala]|uniref:Gaa1-like protein n=1 Tax=Naematelia encephala TaxID=71784 RepID=A0A1Y2AUU5_9TREE|nr:Gaa1-like protein [Naematelia encephala]